VADRAEDIETAINRQKAKTNDPGVGILRHGEDARLIHECPVRLQEWLRDIMGCWLGRKLTEPHSLMSFSLLMDACMDGKYRLHENASMGKTAHTTGVQIRLPYIV